MNEHNVTIAKAYYEAMSNKNLSDVAKYLHDEVELIGPMSHVKGKEAVLDAAKQYSIHLNKINVRAACESGDQAILVYDVDFPAPLGILPAASLMTFQDDLIIRVELFYDTRKLER